MGELDERIAKLSPERRALLELRLMGQGALAVTRPVIGRAEGSRPRRLSFAQERLWFFDQLEPGSAVYNIAMARRITGKLDVVALERSLTEIVRRHESLRTTFAPGEEHPVQLIGPVPTSVLSMPDLTELPVEKREARAVRLANEEARRPFDLAAGPPLRACLLRLDAEDHILVVTIHHIVSGGWSMGILFGELSTLYDAFQAGRPSPLPELPMQYADYAEWQRQWMQGPVLEHQLAYWKKQLGDAPPMAALPSDRARPAVQTYRGARQSAVLSSSLTKALRKLGQREGASLFMTLLSAFKILLNRYTGQDDIVVGTPIAGRRRSEVEGLIGLFLNTLALRTDLSGDPSFLEVLRRVADTALGAYDHQDIPFEMLLQELQPERDMSHAPLFQTFFNVASLPDSPELELSGLRVESVGLPAAHSKFDLTLYVREAEGCIELESVYNTDLFDGPTIGRLLGHYRTLLQGIAADPTQRISRLPILTEAERSQLLVHWNQTQADYPEDLCIHQLFEAQVERTPENVAVVLGDDQLTYRELDERANRLARHLVGRGVGPEALVGICVERSLEMVVGILAILKAGAAYVPLDPTYPSGRLAFMIQDTQVDLLLTQRRLLPDLPPYAGNVVYLDCADTRPERNWKANPAARVAPENLAYVTYTSGSTGRPKGVLVPHRGAVNYLSFYWTAYGLDEKDVVLQLPSFSFDASVRDMLGPLTAGARVVLARPEQAVDPEALLSLVKEHAVTCLPSLVVTVLDRFNQLAGNCGESYDSVRTVLACGELLPSEVAVQAQQTFGQDTLVVNQYGPTEATMIATYYRVLGVHEARGFVPIGRPIPNVKAYVLDENLNVLPVGIPGELYVGGVGVARGYLNRPDLTAEKFIPSPFHPDSNERLYRTGDLARYRPDGNLEFLGRVDNQVKIRGFRIELGEVETTLRAHPAVQEAVAAVREDARAGDQLIAYIVPRRPAVAGGGELREFLRNKLPDYMVPSFFVMLDTLPLTPNGKVDRNALPAPVRARPGLEEAYVAPRTPLEVKLTEIWEDLLNLARIGVHDSFFELGGHSLMATRLVSRMCDAFGVEMPLRSLFETPTIAELAQALDAMRWTARGPQRRSTRHTGRREEGAL